MPTVLWRGHTRVINTKYGRFDRSTPVTVKQEWLDARRNVFDDRFQITDDYPGVLFTIDEGDDGIPDMKWLKADIQQWLYEHGVEMAGIRATKAKMLEKVDEVLAAEVAQEE